MTNVNTIKSMMEMMNIDELRELNLEINKIILDKEDLDPFENLSEEELEDLIDEEYKEVVQRE